MTDPLPTVVQAWSAVMEEVTSIRKDEESAGSGSHRFNFRGVDTVMTVLGHAMRKHGVVVIPHKVLDSKHRDFLDKNNKTVHEAIVTIGYRIYGPAGDHIDGEMIGESADYSDKATAQATSVAYRVFLLQSTTMPTDDVDPDTQHYDRSNRTPEDQLAIDQGWNDAAHRARVWSQGTAAMANCGHRDAVVAWGARLGLDESNLTPQLAERWAAVIGDPNAAELGNSNPAPSDAGFDRAVAWDLLRGRYEALDSDAKAAFAAYMAENSITEATLTEAQSAAAWEHLNTLPTARPTTVKAQGWQSKAERERTYDSLMERTERIGDAERETILAGLAEDGITREVFTKAQSQDWLGLVVAAEAAG